MSEDPVHVNLPPSVDVPVDDGILHTAKDFSGSLTTQMSDAEIQKAFAIVVDVQKRYFGRPNSVDVLEELRDEVVTRLAEVGVLASLDPTPCLRGEPPIIEFVGMVKGHDIHKYGLDHDRKAWEVQRATERNEDFLGQKEKPSGKR